MGRSSKTKRAAIAKKPSASRSSTITKKPSDKHRLDVNKKPSIYVIPIMPKRGIQMTRLRQTRKRPAGQVVDYVRGDKSHKRPRDRLVNAFGMSHVMRPQGPREVTRQLKRLHLLPTQLNCPECGRRLSKLTTLCPGF